MGTSCAPLFPVAMATVGSKIKKIQGSARGGLTGPKVSQRGVSREVFCKRDLALYDTINVLIRKFLSGGPGLYFPVFVNYLISRDISLLRTNLLLSSCVSDMSSILKKRKLSCLLLIWLGL